MTGPPTLEEILRGEDDDTGCRTAREILDAYAELELAGEDPKHVFPGAGIHFEVCGTCRAEHDGLLEAVRWFALGRSAA